MHKASCNCRQLSLTVIGEPIRVSVCHCNACQKRTGSAFGVQARYQLSQVTFSGASHHYQRTGDEGAVITFQFCPHCGGNLWFTMDVMPEVVAIPLGNFADDAVSKAQLASPTMTVYQTRCHDWVKLEGIDEVYD
ncbi:aldehyde-activating protein [Shewanella sp. Choline-02u-19]|uniref:GFA family protein n=1 Tax=unclassified Shewanella TaxID=196818 RepID=UPI000C33F323|nr:MULTISPECIES: GFA family protein [unclassified Shewanella]PKG74731.1 aldehyde-activating protein [Shewanella sp. GutCb]PKH54191.1 aldehyde-activating protein [Shewanella sp. Bg11-22]PKI28162.1 aldehyde-activating protein [Shewanella sp. Choline-02u-19]